MISNLKKRRFWSWLCSWQTGRTQGYRTLSDQRKHCILRRFYNPYRNWLQYSRQRSWLHLSWPYNRQDPGRKRCCLFQSCSLRLLLHEYQCHHNRWPSGQYWRHGNRVASLIHGPKNVIIIAGMNKVCPDLDSAYKRVKLSAAPPNTVRLNRKTPCAVTGQCADCLSPDCICTHTVITRRSNIPGRIKILLVGEELGY